MINAAIVGIGWWGQVLVRSVNNSEKIKVSKGYTRTPGNAGEFIEEMGIKLHDSYEDLLTDDDIDAVILATPHSSHVEQIKLAADAKKHIYVEKPLALTLSETKDAISHARNAGVEICVGFQRRGHPSMVAALSAVRDGSLGRIIHVEGHQSAPGLRIYKPGSWRQERDEQPAGGMTGMGIHLLDSMVSVLGRVTDADVKSVKLLHDNASTLDEITSVLMTFEEGTTGYLGTSIATPAYFSLRFFGENGVVEVRNPDLGELAHTSQTGEVTVQTHTGFNMGRAALEGFADQVSGTGKFLISDDDVINASEALEKIFAAAAN